MNHELSTMNFPEIPDPFCFAPYQPEWRAKYGEKQGFIGMVPKVFEVFGVDENKQEGDAKFAGYYILAF